jgi:peptidoglycan/xylan/chitin deacetylase (PgdA/CDA1 family)
MKIFGIGRLGRVAYWLKKRRGLRGLILMYHSIAEVGSDPWSLCVTPRHFAEHLEVLQKYYRPMQLEKYVRTLQNGDTSHNIAIITFDDGYANNLHNAKPLLERHEIPATVFLTTGYLGQRREFWWDELDSILLQPGKLPEVLRLNINGKVNEWKLNHGGFYSEEEYYYDRNLRPWDGEPGSRHYLYHSIWQLLKPLPHDQQRRTLDEILSWASVEPAVRPTHRPLTVEEVFDLTKGDLIEIGSHTVTHPFLSLHALASQRNEIEKSKDKLEHVLGRPVTSFAYPHGDYNEEVIALVRQAGYECACSTSVDVVRQNTDLFQLPRVQVEDG